MRTVIFRSSLFLGLCELGRGCCSSWYGGIDCFISPG